MSLAGSGVVVTGAGVGIGEALARRLVDGGARVVVNDIDELAARRVAQDIGATAVPGDAATESGVASLISAAMEALDEIDIYFANAGIETGGGLSATEDDWARTFEVNVMAHVRAARILVPRWLERGQGRFVVTASAAGLLTMLGSATYSVSKHASLSFAEWLSATYGHRGVVVQAICPLGVRTQMLEQEDEMVREILSHDEAIEPEAVAESVWAALQDDNFLILPHPKVAEYFRFRATDIDRWIAGMRKLQSRLDTVKD
ncbi:MAG: SDR family NAD(P)-dependent oxidoreductase [Actinobacteria bacterium]|nr:SDR family NAD(P)-dependent oxidoreductase [Actinomycetota bacterium]